MKKIEKITKYVSDLFELYHMNTYGFFEDYDEDLDTSVEVPLFRYGKIDDETIKKIGVNFGLTKEEILNADMEAGKKYWNRFPFFRMYEEFLAQWKWNQQFKDPMPSAEEYLLNAIFGTKKGIAVRLRYDIPSIKERLIEQLKEIDEYIPGTYHENAQITDLKIATQTVFSFPKCGEMLRAFLQIVERVKELFFKALSEDLTQDEANELNFLVSLTHAVDAVTPSTKITYDTICSYRTVYLEENHEDFYKYVKFKRFAMFNPWRCFEFFDDMELVKQLFDAFPQAKGDMRKFALELTKFECDFLWSDAQPIQRSEEEEKELEDIDNWLGVRHIPVEERPKARTRIYVEKNRSETYGWGKYIKLLKKMSGPVIRGGLEIPDRTFPLDRHATFLRIQKRVAAKNGGSNNG